MRFVVCLTLCYFILVFFSPFSIAITSLGEERANLSAFRTFDRFVLVWICRFPLPLDVWDVAVCDCGTSWTFRLPFFSHVHREVIIYNCENKPECKSSHISKCNDRDELVTTKPVKYNSCIYVKVAFHDRVVFWVSL